MGTSQVQTRVGLVPHEHSYSKRSSSDLPLPPGWVVKTKGPFSRFCLPRQAGCQNWTITCSRDFRRLPSPGRRTQIRDRPPDRSRFQLLQESLWSLVQTQLQFCRSGFMRLTGITIVVVNNSICSWLIRVQSESSRWNVRVARLEIRAATESTFTSKKTDRVHCLESWFIAILIFSRHQTTTKNDECPNVDHSRSFSSVPPQNYIILLPYFAMLI